MAELPVGALGPLPEGWDKPKASPPPEGSSPLPAEGAPKSEARKLFDVITDPLADMRKYVLNQGARGFLNRINSTLSGLEATRRGEIPMTFGMMRLLLPAGVVDELSGIGEQKRKEYLVKEEGRAKDLQKRYGRTGSYEPERFDPNSEPMQPPEPDLKAPGPVSKVVGAMAETMADPANAAMGPGAALGKNVPMLAKLAMNEASAAFSGAGADVGGDVGAGVGRFMGDEDTGRAVGSVVGSTARAPVTSTVAAGGKASMGPIGDAYNAARNALRSKRARDERSLRAILSDEWSNLRAESKGFIKQRVQEQLADVIDRDPSARQALADWERAANTAGVPIESGSLAQRTGTPLLVETQRDYIPQTKDEAKAVTSRLAKDQALVEGTYKRIMGRKTSPEVKDIVAGLEDYRLNTNAKLNALADEAVSQRDTLTNWNSADAHDAGARLRELHETERVRHKKAVIDPAFQAFKESEGSISAKHLEGLLSPILGKTLTEVDPSTVSPNLRGVIDLVQPTVTGGRKAAPGIGGTPGSGPEETTKVYRNLSTSDLSDINRALNLESRTLAGRSGQDIAVALSNLTKARGDIVNVMRERLPPEAFAKFEEANRLYGATYAPGFAEGTGANIRKTAGAARPGEERIINEQVIPAYLNPRGGTGPTETSMRQFDAAFGGELTGNRVGEAYDLLGKQIETDYARKVLNKRDLSPDLHENFIRDYEAALNRVPQVRDRLEATGTKLFELGAEAKLIEESYQTITGHALTRTLGIEEASRTMSHALANPDKMAQLVSGIRKTQGEKGVESLLRYAAELGNPRTNGEFDGRKIRALINAGKATLDRPGGLERLYTEALGEKAGRAHYERVRAIGAIADRMAATEPTHLRPQRGEKGPVEQAAGQSAASGITAAYALATGRAGPVNIGSVVGGRYLNSRFQKAWKEAEHAALYDPKDSAAVLDMMRNPQGPWAKATGERLASRMGKDGKAFLEKLIAQDLLIPLTAQGAALGVRKAAEEDKRSAEEKANFQEGKR